VSAGPPPSHLCHQFKTELVWEPWRKDGSLRERVARSIPLCRECGAPRPKRTPRRRVRVQVEARRPEKGLLLTENARKVTEKLTTRRRGPRPIRAKGLFSTLAGGGLPGSVVEAELERLLRLGLVRLTYKLRGERRELYSVELRDPEAIEDAGFPGRRDGRREAVARARSRLEPLTHPLAAEVERILSGPDLERLSPLHVDALAAVAVHAASGDVLSRRVFSAHYLGSSKALSRVHGLVRSLIGPLRRLGIREGNALTQVGGTGVLHLAGEELDLQRFPPCVGLSRETLARLDEIELPTGALLLVENLAVFTACCRGEVRDLRGTTVVWTAGYPGRGVRSLVEAADRAGARVDIWADLDLDGIRIARLVAQWTARANPIRMSPADLAAAPVTRRTEPRARRAIEDDLAARPDALLANSLEAIRDAGRWVEQEVFLVARGK